MTGPPTPAPAHPLVDAATLSRELADGRVTLLDVRWRLDRPDGRADFEAGHLPGAVYVDLDTELADPASPGDDRGRHPLPGSGRFLAAMRRAGVRRDRPVVVYDDWGGVAAARAWWLLRDHGHGAVRLLDGGLAAWRAEGGTLETGPGRRPEPGDLDGTPGRMPVVGADTLAGTGVVVDARAAERFRGEQEPVDPVAGHVPGAVNVPVTEHLDRRGRFRDPATLAATYAGAGVAPGADVAAYCGSGVAACHSVLALELAGVRAALYPPSWSGWISDPDRPVALGDAPRRSAP